MFISCIYCFELPAYLNYSVFDMIIINKLFSIIIGAKCNFRINMR